MPTLPTSSEIKNTVLINDHQLVVQKCQGCVVHPWPPFASPKSLIATEEVPEFLPACGRDQFGITTIDVERFEVFQSFDFNQYSTVMVFVGMHHFTYRELYNTVNMMSLKW